MNASYFGKMKGEMSSIEPFGLKIDFSGTPDVRLDSLPIDELKELLLKHRLILLRGAEPITEREAYAEQCKRWGELLAWDFGTVFEVVEHSDPKNYLFTSGSVPYHWDGAFAARVPWLQMFQCHEAPGVPVGGETIFCDTTALWNSLPAATQALWKKVVIEYSTEKVAHYGGAVRAPLIDKHPLTGETTIRFAEPANATTVDLNTPQLKVEGIDVNLVPAFLADLTRRVYDPNYVVAHNWQSGDYLIADNHALLHGRNSYGRQLPRRLWRVHVL